MKERMDKKTPLLQSGVIAAGANWNPRYHPVFITHEARGLWKEVLQKTPLFPFGNRGDMRGTTLHYTLCLYP